MGGLTGAKRSNAVWTVDFKGWWRTADGQRVDPLTVRDMFSRYVLAAWLLPASAMVACPGGVSAVISSVLGLPAVIRVDNGGPFASAWPGGIVAAECVV